MLASASPRRAALLRSAGLSFTVDPSRDVDESWFEGEDPEAYAARVARAKALEVYARRPEALVLGADTTVWIPGEPLPLGKPADREHAARMVTTLTAAGEHRVTTAFALLGAGIFQATHVTTHVWMRSFEKGELQAYLDHGDWTDKAGAYAIQGRAATLVERVEGSYTNVVGLPLSEVTRALVARGLEVGP